MLFDPTHHEALAGGPWDTTVARRFIASVSNNADLAFQAGTFWPSHPHDSDWDPGVPLLSLYWGAAGTAWALLELQRMGVVGAYRHDYRAVLREALNAYAAAPDTGAYAPGYLMGELGILSVLCRHSPDTSDWDRLEICCEQALARPENELMWGAPGALLAAWWALGQTNHPRWEGLVQRARDVLLGEWKVYTAPPFRLWLQNLYGKRRLYLGFPHGLAGNLAALLKTGHVGLEDDVAQSVVSSAVVDGEYANWPSYVGEEGTPSVQWCHGAPGMVLSLREFPVAHSPELENLLVRAGNLVWAAGPLKKPHGLCHGTAGNGHAFLSLYRRTGNAMWLERARHFAMHAIAQSRAEAARHGRERYALFTGDLGVALYAHACIMGDDRFPLTDFI